MRNVLEIAYLEETVNTDEISHHSTLKRLSTAQGTMREVISINGMFDRVFSDPGTEGNGFRERWPVVRSDLI